MEDIKIDYKTETTTLDSKTVEQFVKPEWTRWFKESKIKQLIKYLESGVGFKDPIYVNIINNKLRVVQGNHRIEAVKRFLDKHPQTKTQIQVNKYKNLTELEEKKLYEILSTIDSRENKDEVLNAYKNEFIIYKKTQKDFPCGVTIRPSKADNIIKFANLVETYLLSKQPISIWTIDKFKLVYEVKEMGEKEYTDMYTFMEEFKRVFGKPCKENKYNQTNFFVPFARIFYAELNGKGGVPISELMKRVDRFVIGNSEIGDLLAGGSGMSRQKIVYHAIIRNLNRGGYKKKVIDEILYPQTTEKPTIEPIKTEEPSKPQIRVKTPIKYPNRQIKFEQLFQEGKPLIKLGELGKILGYQTSFERFPKTLKSAIKNFARKYGYNYKERVGFYKTETPEPVSVFRKHGLTKRQQKLEKLFTQGKQTVHIREFYNQLGYHLGAYDREIIKEVAKKHGYEYKKYFGFTKKGKELEKKVPQTRISENFKKAVAFIERMEKEGRVRLKVTDIWLAGGYSYPSKIARDKLLEIAKKHGFEKITQTKLRRVETKQDIFVKPKRRSFLKEKIERFFLETDKNEVDCVDIGKHLGRKYPGLDTNTRDKVKEVVKNLKWEERKTKRKVVFTRPQFSSLNQRLKQEFENFPTKFTIDYICDRVMYPTIKTNNTPEGQQRRVNIYTKIKKFLDKKIAKEELTFDTENRQLYTKTNHSVITREYPKQEEPPLLEIAQEEELPIISESELREIARRYGCLNQDVLRGCEAKNKQIIDLPSCKVIMNWLRIHLNKTEKILGKQIKITEDNIEVLN